MEPELEQWVGLTWVGDGSRSVPGLPMGDVILPADEAAQMLRTGLWVIATPDGPPADEPLATELEVPASEPDAPVADEPIDPLVADPEMPA